MRTSTTRRSNAKIAALKKEPTLTDSVNADWASVDKMVDSAGSVGGVHEPASSPTSSMPTWTSAAT